MINIAFVYPYYGTTFKVWSYHEFIVWGIWCTSTSICFCVSIYFRLYHWYILMR